MGKAKVVEQIVARTQEELMARSQGETKTSRHKSRGQAWMEQGRVQETSQSRSRAGRLEHPSEGQVAMIDDVEKRSNQQPSTRKYEQDKSSRRPFTQHNIALGAASVNSEMPRGLFNGQRSAMISTNLNLVIGDTDDSGSFEDSDGSSDKGVVESNMESFIRQQEAELCNAYRIGRIQSSSKKPLEKKKYTNRKKDAAERLCDDTSRI